MAHIEAGILLIDNVTVQNNVLSEMGFLAECPCDYPEYGVGERNV
jgi:hypothetical protein